MPSAYFREAFRKLEATHEVVYRDVDPQLPFVASTPSELKLREFQGSPIQVASWMSGVDILAVHGAPVTEAVVEASSALRVICCARGGPVNVDVDSATENGVIVVNTPGKNAEAVADLTLAFMISLARGLRRGQMFLDDGNQLHSAFDGASFIGSELGGKVLGLVGYGEVGRRVATRALAFGMRALVFDPFLRVADGPIEQVESLEVLLARSDFVSLHARASAANERMFGADLLAKMKRGAFFINTARESLVDENALDNALERGHLGGAALDVFEEEQSGRPHRLLRHPNAVMTPHLGGATRETLARGAQMAADEIKRLVSGETLVNIVNRELVDA